MDVSQHSSFRLVLRSDTVISVNCSSVVKVSYSIYLCLKGSAVPPACSAGCTTVAALLLPLISFLPLFLLYSFPATFGKRGPFLRGPGSQSEGHGALPLPCSVLPCDEIG